ncbi:MAG TPA: mechanosensitive ion channel domain-containing protein [Planctomycetaceae bacterium]|nr:mechanosensitive ion channel domain-containing protein [Planctomycetaceae bacterium]
MRTHRDVRPPERRAPRIFETGLLALCLLCSAAPAPASPKAETVTADVIEVRQKDAAKSKDLDDATRSKVLDFYRHAAEALTAADGFVKQTDESKSKTKEAPQAASDAKSEQKRLRESAELSEAAGRAKHPEDRTVAALESALFEARTSLEPLLKKQMLLEKEPNRRANRRKEIRELLLAAQTDSRDLRKQLVAEAPKDEPGAVSLARRTSLQARSQCIEKEVPALQAELARYEAEDAVELVRLKRDLLAQQIALAQQQIKQLTESLDKARRLEAERAVADARRMQVEAHPLLRSLAAENTRLAEELQARTKPIETAEHDLKLAKDLSEQLGEQFSKTREKAAGVGMTETIGQLLRKQRAKLPDPSDFQRSVDVRSQAIDETQFRLYELEENRSSVDLANPEPLIQKTLAQAPPGLSADDRKNLGKAAREMLQTKQQYLDQLTRNYNNYYDTLLDLVDTQRRLIGMINTYADYVDERVLWIRSSRPLGSWMSDLFRGKPIGWLVRPANWQQVAGALASDAQSNPLGPIGLFLLIPIFWYTRNRFRSEIGKLGQEAHRSNYTRFLPTSRAFLLTFFTSALASAILWYVGWRLAAVAYDVDFPSAVSDGLIAVALLYLPLDLVRRTCRPDGLAADHFGWSQDAVRTLARDARWLMVFGLPVTFVTEMLHSSDPDRLRNALERMLMAGGLVLVAVFHYRILRPHSQLVRQLLPHGHDDWINRLQAVCRALGVGGPLVLSVLVVTGYDYTARQFIWRLYLTAIAVLACSYARALFLRWILIHRRLMGMQQVKERRVTELRSTVSADASTPAAVHAEPAEKINLAALSEQTRTLVNVGILSTLFVALWRIWLDVFPSMGILNHCILWTVTVGDRIEPITLGSFLVAAFIVALTWISVRNIPGLLEMTVLERLRIDAAGRFAFSTLARYAIVVIGLVSASSTIGIGWAKVQWLATALTFGLAFGLQEIFANFIAGLIILFERPVRVGDMVTIENVTGVVSRIRIRATTITDSDRKEFIVPNKEFITGRTLNWTLSDTINRIVINVGLAYGSDTDLAREILLKAAHDHPAVLRDPAPSASFEEFGETSLRLVLRCFLPNLTERTRVIHELHTAINRELTVHGIEISPPHAEPVAKPTLPLVTSRKADSTSEPHARVAG